MSKFWSILAAIGMSAVTAVTPVIQGALSAHPVAVTIISGAIAVILHWLPSPAQPPSA